MTKKPSYRSANRRRIAKIIDSTPLIASLLYDIDLLPEQIKRGDMRRYLYMVAVIEHMQAAAKMKP